MPHNQHLLNRLEGIRLALMAQHTGGKGLPNATIGSERETFLREFLQKVFPAHRRFASGAITDSTGEISGQVDIAVEYPFVPSFPMPSTDERLFLAESVAMVIEVKSDLNKQWTQACNTVRKVKALKRELNTLMTFGTAPPQQIPCVVVGYKGFNAIESLQLRIDGTEQAERPDAALVIESGCFCGAGVTANGPLGLYALCLTINRYLTSLGHAAPKLTAYVDTDTPTGNSKGNADEI